MADMIKFYKGAVASLPASGVNGALYITTDEGAIYLGTGTGMKRLGDFVQVDNVASLPAKAHESCLYYCVAENILAKWNGIEWKQINKQPTADELKTLLGLGSAAYTDASAYDAAGSAQAVRDYVGDIPEEYTEETIVAYINKKAEETLNAASGGSSESAASVLAALNTYKTENDPKVTANTEAITAIKDGTTIDSFADVETELAKKVDKVEGYSLVADTEIARLANVKNYDDAAIVDRVADLETIAATHAVKTEVDAAVALKADKSVVDAMYTNAKIDELVQGAKDYADANDADTKYGIVYDSDNKKIKLVEGGTEVEIDATDFIKDGMIDTVALSEDGLNLVITWNTDAGKDATTIPLTGLVDVYTGVVGDRVTVSVSSDDKISADLVAGSISKNYLDDAVQASLALADSALQSHQDISHLATEADLTLAENRISALEAIDHEAYKAYADQAEADAIAAAAADATAKADAALETAKTDAANKDAVVLSEAQGYTDQAKADAIADAEGKVNALAGNVYTKTETYTQDEVDAAIETAVTNACSWGEF